MKRNKTIRVIALLFLTAISCDNKAPDLDDFDQECKNASCCNPEFNEFVEYISDAPMHLNGGTLRSLTGYPSDDKNPYKSSILSICEKSLDKIKGLAPDTVMDDPTKLTYSYKVSGKVLSDVKNPRNVVTPVLSVYIDKIEIIKN